MDFRDRHVVITGGTGALGGAVVAALLEAGAFCHVPCRDEAEAKRSPLRDQKNVTLAVTGNLAEEPAGRCATRMSRRCTSKFTQTC